MNLDAVTLQGCLGMFGLEGYATALGDGKILEFEPELGEGGMG